MRYTIENEYLKAEIAELGATLTKLIDKKTGTDVVLGFDTDEDYIRYAGTNIGATIGRNCNRIGNARFELNGKTYRLSVNDNMNQLHGGGINGFAFKHWKPERVGDDEIVLSYDAKDGEEGFPGNLHTEVTYRLEEDTLFFGFEGTCDQDTLFNITNHSYFNLNGHDSGSVLGHIVQIGASEYTPSDPYLLTTGIIESVAGTPMDFTIPKMIGDEIEAEFEALINGMGYDHNYVIARSKGEYREAASLYSRESGIRMEVLTDMPGLQMYTANFMKGEAGKNGAVYGPRSAVCFETQYWPDSLNKEGFPDCILAAGEEFRSRTTYSFSR